jgi:hypothetical protein
VNFSDSAANFSMPNAGTNISVAVASFTGSGAQAGNYTFNTSAQTSADINPFVLNLASSCTYNGTTVASASLFGHNGVMPGVNGGIWMPARVRGSVQFYRRPHPFAQPLACRMHHHAPDTCEPHDMSAIQMLVARCSEPSADEQWTAQQVAHQRAGSTRMSE